MATNNSIVPAKSPDKDWAQIVDQIVEEMGDDLPDQVIRATELLLAGYPTHKAAQDLNVKPSQIKEWLRKYPTMALTVANGRKLLSRWRMSKLEQQFVAAIDKSQEILELDLADRSVNAKLVTVVAQQARYVIGLFAGQRMDINIKLDEDTDTTLKAQRDALDYLAGELAKQKGSDQPIEATYRIVEEDPQKDTRKPMLDDNGNPLNGELGVLDTAEDGTTLCHICGCRVALMGVHISNVHHMKLKEYELLFMLPLGSIDKRDNEAYGKPISD